jgi:two-component system, cell cycle response regulator
MSIVRSVSLTSSEKMTGNSPGRVLVAEDDVMFRRILQKWLENWGYEVTVAEDGGKAWSILQQERSPELLILDWMMPEIEGVELCRRIRERQRPPYQYILLVTGKDDKEDLVRGLEAGADDYLTKPFEQNELRAHLLVAKRILKLQQDLINAREELRSQAMHDVLTEIWNRGAVLDQLGRELERAARAQTPTGVLMLDLDHFKKINDTYGHLTGDAVLREVAKRLTDSVRSYDMVGRYGGEEFVVVLPNCGKAEIEQNAERTRLAISSMPILTDPANITITVSVGATVATAGTGSKNDILTAADEALYQAKEGGRNRVCVKGLEYKAILPMQS